MTPFDTITAGIWVLMIIYSFVIRAGAREAAAGRSQDERQTVAATPEAVAVYRHAVDSAHMLAGLRFAYVVLLALLTFGFAAISVAARLGPYQHSSLATVAMASTATLLVLQERLLDQWRRAARSSSSFEAGWGMNTTTIVEPSVLNSANAIRLLHLLAGSLWLLLLG